MSSSPCLQVSTKSLAPILRRDFGFVALEAGAAHSGQLRQPPLRPNGKRASAGGPRYGPAARAAYAQRPTSPLGIFFRIICCVFCSARRYCGTDHTAHSASIMPFASEDQVNLTLRPYFSDFVSLLRQAHEDWTTSRFASSMQDPKVRATVVWNQFLHHAKAAFEDRPGVRVENMRHWQGLVIANSFFVRMKKSQQKIAIAKLSDAISLEFQRCIS